MTTSNSPRRIEYAFDTHCFSIDSSLRSERLASSGICENASHFRLISHPKSHSEHGEESY